MAGFLDVLSANVTNAGRTVSQKAKNISEATSLTNEQRAETRKIQEAYSEIGKLYYEKFKDTLTPDSDFVELMDTITKASARIDALQEEIESIRARKPELVDVPEYSHPTPAAEKKCVMYCMGCGATYGAGQAYCEKCGYKLEEQKASAAPAETVADVEQQAQAPAAEKPTATPVSVPLVNPAPKPPLVNGAPVILEKPAEPAAETPETADVPETTDAPETPAAPEAPAAPTEEAACKFCAYCGKPRQAEQNFCTECGNKF